MEIHPRPRELHSRRRSLRTVRLVPVRTVPARINPQPIAVPVAPPPIEPIAIGPEQPCPVAIPDDNSPAARARRARRKLRRLFEDARRAAHGKTRLRRDDEYQLLRCAYAVVRCWEREGVGQEIDHELEASRRELLLPSHERLLWRSHTHPVLSHRSHIILQLHHGAGASVHELKAFQRERVSRSFGGLLSRRRSSS